MLEKFRELFSPRIVVGLKMDKDRILAVQVSNPAGSPVIDRIAVQDISNPENASQELDSFLRREKISPELLVSSLAASDACVREISIPLQKPKKLGRILKYQMEPFVPHPVETMVVDHLPAEPGQPITAVAVEKNVLSVHLEVLRRAGLEPGVVSLDAVALFGLYLRLNEEEPPGAEAIVHREREETLVLVVDRCSLKLFRVLHGSGEHLAQIRQTLDLYKLKHPDRSILKILLTGPGAHETAFARKLGEATGMGVVPWRPFDSVKHGLGEMDAETQTLFALPLGLAIGSFASTLRSFSLRREEFALQTSAHLKGPLVYMAVAVLLLGCLSTFGTYQRLHASQRNYTALRSEIMTIFRAACPDTPNVLKGMELEQMRQKINEETREYKWLEGLTGREAALDLLLVLTRNLSGYKDVKVDNISLEGKRVDLDGRASSFQSVDNLKSVLERTGFFTQIKLVGAKMDNRDRMVRFNFVMERQA